MSWKEDVSFPTCAGDPDLQGTPPRDLGIAVRASAGDTRQCHEPAPAAQARQDAAAGRGRPCGYLPGAGEARSREPGEQVETLHHLQRPLCPLLPFGRGQARLAGSNAHYVGLAWLRAYNGTKMGAPLRSTACAEELG